MKLILIAAVSALALSLGACKDDPHTLTSDELSKATTGAREYAVNSGDTFLGCNGTDSPPVDDHTSCTLKTKGGSTYGLQCSYKATGCKPK